MHYLIEYYIEGYNTDNIAVNGLEQALQISIAINNFNKAEKVCELLLIEQPDNIKIVQTLTDLSLFNKKYDLIYLYSLYDNVLNIDYQ